MNYITKAGYKKEFKYQRYKLTLLHYAWILLYSNTLLFFSRTENITSLDFGSLYRMSLVFIAGLFVILKATRSTYSLLSIYSTPLGWFFFYGFVGMVSSFYSSEPFYSMWKSIEIIVVVILLSVILDSKDRISAIFYLYKITLIMIALTAATPFFWLLISPKLALKPIGGILHYSLQGVRPWLNANTFGSLAAITAYTNFANSTRVHIKSKKRFYRIIFFVAFVGVIFSGSRTALAALFTGILIFAFYDKRFKLFVFVVSFIGILVSINSLQDVMMSFITKEQSVKCLTTLTGRTTGWELAWEYFKKAPFIGHGMAAAGRFDVLNDTVSTLHGALFDVIVGVGLLGAVPWMTLILSTGIKLFIKDKRIVKTLDERSGRAELLGLYALIIVRTSTSSGLAFHDKETLLFLCILTLSIIGREGFAMIGKSNKNKNVIEQTNTNT